MKTPTIKNIAEIKSYLVDSPMMIDESIASVRTDKATVQQMLLDNESVIKGGNVYYFAFKHIGLNVYTVKLRPLGKINSWIVDEFEKHLIHEHADGYPTARY
tara:strand:- start:295 stop:600 length:306 start_codon:yes stop_codon:yes gene_type:complete